MLRRNFLIKISNKCFYKIIIIIFFKIIIKLKFRKIRSLYPIFTAFMNNNIACVISFFLRKIFAELSWRNCNFHLLLIAYRSHTFTNSRENHRDFACPAYITKARMSLSPITVVRLYHWSLSLLSLLQYDSNQMFIAIRFTRFMIPIFCCWNRLANVSSHRTIISFLS